MGHRLSRRRFLKGSAAAGVLTAAPAVIARPGWSQTGPIRIGVLEPRSGRVKWRARYPNPPLESRVPDLTMGRYAECVRWLTSVIKKAGTLDTARLIKEWEGAKFDMEWGEVEMRAVDHQMQTPGYVAEVIVPEKIPPEIRCFGNECPYIGRPVRIPGDDIAQPARDTGNRRCA